MKRLKYVAVGATAALALGLAACGGGGNSGGGGGETGGGGDAGGGGGASSDVKLTWWATQLAPSIPDTEAVYKESIARFTEATGIEVEVEVVPWGDLYNKVLTAVSSGTGPDVLSLGTTWTASLNDTGAFAEVADNLEALGGSDKFVPAVWDATVMPDGSQTAVPFMSAAYALLYNPVLFEEAGITEPPSTWEEFIEVGKELTVDKNGDGTPDQWGFTFPAAAGSGDTHFGFILANQLGGNIVDDDGAAAVDSPEVVEAVTLFTDLMGAEGIMSPSDAEITLDADAVDKFINGDAAMTFNQRPYAQFRSRDFTDFAVSNVPVVEGGEDVQSMIAGTNISVFEDSKNKNEAFQFIGHLTSAEEQAVIANGFTMLPSVSAAYDDPAFADAMALYGEVQQGVLADAARPFPLVANIGEIEAALGTAMREVFQGIATNTPLNVNDRLAQAQAQIR